MYSDLSSNVKASNILNRKGKMRIGLGIWRCLGCGLFFFLREIADGAGQNLG